MAIASAATEGGEKKGLPSRLTDPYGSMTPAAREASDMNALGSFQSRYTEWLQTHSFTNEQLAQLPRHSSLTLSRSSVSSLSEAARNAERIVLGVSGAIRFDPYRALITFNVERTIKGERTGTLTVDQPGGPYPDPDFQGAFLGINDGSPLLLPGTRSILLLQSYPDRPGTFSPQILTGILTSVGGKVYSLPGNPFAGDVDGKIEDAVVDILRAQPS